MISKTPKQLVTMHTPRLQRLSSLKAHPNPTVQPSRIPGRIPSRPSAPPSHVPGAVRPRRDVERAVRPMDSGKMKSIVSSASRAAAQLLHDEDAELEFAETEANTALQFDISKIDPGPSREDVPCGYNCGSCIKFLALNDPRRDDPEFLETYLSSNNHCPVAVLELAKLKGKRPEDVVAKADSVACAKFKLDTHRASEKLRDILSLIRETTRGEYDIIVASLESIGREKSNEDKYGCRIGQRERISISGYEGLHQAIVCGFKGKNILLKVRVGGRELIVKRPIVDAKVIE